MHTHTHTHTHIHTHPQGTHTRTLTHSHAHTCTCTQTHTYIPTHTLSPSLNNNIIDERQSQPEKLVLLRDSEKVEEGGMERERDRWVVFRGRQPADRYSHRRRNHLQHEWHQLNIDAEPLFTESVCHTTHQQTVYHCPTTVHLVHDC